MNPDVLVGPRSDRLANDVRAGAWNGVLNHTCASGFLMIQPFLSCPTICVLTECKYSKNPVYALQVKRCVGLSALSWVICCSAKFNSF